MKRIKSSLEHKEIKSVVIKTKDGKTEIYANVESIQVLDNQNHMFVHTSKLEDDSNQIKLPFNYGKK